MNICSVVSVGTPFFGGGTPVIVGEYDREPIGVPLVGHPFKIFLHPVGGNWPDSGTITVSDGGAGGAFSDSTLDLTGGDDTIQFTYTPAAAGTVTISFSNNASLDDPDDLILNVRSTLPLRSRDYIATTANRRRRR